MFVIRAASGSYAEYATAEESMVGHLSDSLSFQEGAAIGIPYFTALKALCILYEVCKHIFSYVVAR